MHPLSQGRAPKLKLKIDAASPIEIVVCSVVKPELFFGAAKSLNPARTLQSQEYFLSRFASLPFDDTAAKFYGPIRAQLESSGKPIGPNDLQIASIAIANAVTLVTHNVAEFGRISGLNVVDWEL
jgi:tRNA(fMet)-specific endonuclease VapC